jgi:hypothetical protein
MSDDTERSVASAGSHPASGGPITLRLSNEEQQEILSRLSGRQSGTLLPLDLPQPTLTDAEREAIAWFSIYSDTPGEERHAVVLANLLERTK